MSFAAPRIAAVLLAAVLVLASTPTSAAEPGKDPNGKSAEAPGQQQDREHGREGRRDQDPDEATPEPSSEGEPSTEFILQVVLDDVAAVNDELLRVANEHLEAGVPVTLQPTPTLFNGTMPDLGGLEDLIDPAILAPPQFAPQPSPGNRAMSDEECDLLVYGIMGKYPFLDAGVRLECLPPAELPLEKVPAPRAPKLPVNLGIHTD